VVTSGSPIDHGQRRVWERERSRLGLGDDLLDATQHPALAILDRATVGVVLIPRDPLAPLLDFDAAALDALPDRFTGQIANGVLFLNAVVTGGQYLLRVARNAANEPARALVGLSRHGGALAGVGAPGRYQLRTDGPDIYRLSSFAGAVRAALKAQRDAIAVVPKLAGPFELLVVAPGASGCLLGGYAPGWEPVEHSFDPPLCTVVPPAVRLEVEDFPADDAGLDALLTGTMSRVVNIFGTTSALYADSKDPNCAVAPGY